MIPADSLAVIRLNNFDFTVSQLDQFLAGVMPIPGGVSMLTRTALASILGSPQLAGLNTQGNFTAFITIGSFGPSAYIMAPVTDYSLFVSDNTNISEPDEKGVSTIAGPIPLLVVKADKYAFISVSMMNNHDALVATAKSLTQTTNGGLAAILDAEETKKATNDRIWIHGNVQLASQMFGPMLFAKIDEIKQMMEGFQDAGGELPMTSPAEIMDMYAVILELLMEETKSLSIAINPTPDALNITTTIAALPGTEMASLLTADPADTSENKLIGYLENDAMVTASGKLTGKINASFMDFFATTFMENMSMTDEEAAKLKALAADAAVVFSGTDAMTMSLNPQGQPPFKIKYVIEVKDTDSFNKLLDQSMEMTKSGPIAELYENMGMEMNYTIKRAADTYKGVSIDSAKLEIKMTDPDSQQAQVITAMYGDGFDYRWAIVDGLWSCIISPDPDADIRKLIDQIKDGQQKEPASEIKAALEALPDAKNADFIATFNLLRTMKMGMAFSPTPMPQIDMPTKSNLAIAGKIDSGKFTINTVLPKEHLTEIVTMGMMMNQMIQQQMMPNQM